MTRNDLIGECKLRHDAGELLESLISYLRTAGCSKIDSIVVLRSSCGIDLGHAKQLVHCSPTWADVLESDNAFHADLEELANTIGDDRS